MNSYGVKDAGFANDVRMARSLYEPDLSSHMTALDALRGMAILMVTAYRFGSPGNDGSLFERATFGLIGQGHRGVDLFFVLSGFLITGILYDSKLAPRYFRTFYARRTLRIFPLYYGCLFVMLVLLPWIAPSSASLYQDSIDHQSWLWMYGTNFLLAWQNAWELPGFNHFWSLAVEEHFYLIWPLVIFLCTRRAAMQVCLACIVGAPLLRVYLLWLGNAEVAVEALTPCRMDSLAIGGLLALTARGPAGVRGLVPWTCAVAVIAGIAAASLWWITGTAWRLGHTFLAVLFGAMILIGITTNPSGRAGRIWNSRVLRFCGTYSYGWYVFQGPLAPVLQGIFTADDLGAWIGSAFVGRILYVLWGSSLSLALAVLSWHLYEKHFLKLKNIFARKDGGAAPLDVCQLPSVSAPTGRRACDR